MQHRVAESRLTVPNALCVLRMLGCPVLLYFAHSQRLPAFLYLFVFLVLTDWIDGKIARWLNQRSTFGARLDSWADAALYACLIISAWWLNQTGVCSESPWIAIALFTYVIAVLCGLIKFRRWPAYHTRSAKICWFLIAASAVAWFANVSPWPLRITMVCVTLTNLESLAITLMLSEWRADVSGVFQAVRLKKAGITHGREME